VLDISNRYNMGTTKSSRVYRKVVLKKNKITQSGDAPLYLRLTIDQVSHFVSLGEYIHPSHWDEEGGVVLEGANNSQKLNHFIGQKKNKIDRIILDLENQDKLATFDSILKEYKAGASRISLPFTGTRYPPGRANFLIAPLMITFPFSAKWKVTRS
jgi:hypothetical protein